MEQVDSKVDSKATRKTRLTQYRKNAGRWQFYAVARNQDGKPNPENIVIEGQQVNWQSPGAKFYLDWLDPVSGKRVREIVGVAPREAKDAWFRKSKILAGEDDQDESVHPQPNNRTIDDAIDRFLVEVKATKGAATLKAYKRDLRWFRKHCSEALRLAPHPRRRKGSVCRRPRRGLEPKDHQQTCYRHAQCHAGSRCKH